MSQREKRLLAVFSTVIVILGLLAYSSFYLKKIKKLESKLSKVTLQAEISKNAEIIDAKYTDEKKWLQKYEPKNIKPSEADIELEKFVSRSGENMVKGLIQAMQPLSVQDGHYHENIVRVKGEISSDQLVDWIKKLHSPKNFRAVTDLKIIPKDSNPSELICTVTIKQWIPLENNDKY